MVHDYIPVSDADFDAWQKLLAASAADSPEAPAAPPALAAARAAWQAAYPAHLSAHAAARSATVAKRESRAAYVAALRAWVRQVQADPATTDGLRGKLGLTVPDAIRTPAAAPAERPSVSVQGGLPLRHYVDIRVLGTGRRKKPRGVRGGEIWLKLGSPPTGMSGTTPGDLRFVALATASPHIVSFSSADAGQTAYYLCRWISTRGQVGPWSERVEATVAG